MRALNGNAEASDGGRAVQVITADAAVDGVGGAAEGREWHASVVDVGGEDWASKSLIMIYDCLDLLILIWFTLLI